jgi:hypothetical protein
MLVSTLRVVGEDTVESRRQKTEVARDELSFA